MYTVIILYTYLYLSHIPWTTVCSGVHCSVQGDIPTIATEYTVWSTTPPPHHPARRRRTTPRQPARAQPPQTFWIRKLSHLISLYEPSLIIYNHLEFSPFSIQYQQFNTSFICTQYRATIPLAISLLPCPSGPQKVVPGHPSLRPAVRIRAMSSWLTFLPNHHPYHHIAISRRTIPTQKKSTGSTLTAVIPHTTYIHIDSHTSIHPHTSPTALQHMTLQSHIATTGLRSKSSNKPPDSNSTAPLE